MTEIPDYLAMLTADEELEAEMREMARETEASMVAAAIISLAAFGGLLLAGGVCLGLLWLMLVWAA